MYGAHSYACVYAAARIENLDITALFALLNPPAPACLLESMAGGASNARYSIIGMDSLLELQAPGISGSADPLRDFIETNQAVDLGLPHFSGGLIGCWSYDLGLTYLGITPDPGKFSVCPEQQFFVPGTVLVHDRHEQLLKVFIWSACSGSPDSDYLQACARIREILQQGIDSTGHQLKHPQPRRDRPVDDTLFEVNIDRDAFMKKVEIALKHVELGDVFQIQVSRRWKRRSPAAPWQVYLTLRQLNPSPYLFYLKLGDFVLLGASPEIQVTVKQDRAVLRPIAGTRKVTGQAVRDEATRRELLNDEKERAEHLMLVDLARNDLGRVSRTGSVMVTDLMTLEAYSHVVHLVSNVESTLKEKCSSLDAFAASFPAGTLTGAPKRKAMEIIDTLEPDSRGLYGGAVGHVDFQGNLDSAIVIRSIVWQNGVFYLQAAAGIVADSRPDDEYKETLNKARAPMLAILEAEDKS